MTFLRFRPGSRPVPGRGAAFTLVELLVTMVVGTIMIVFLFQLFSASTRAWRQGEDQVETYREARAALQMMTRDLSQTIQPMTGSVYATPGATPPVVAPGLVLDYYDSSALVEANKINEEVYCLTMIPNDGASNLCAVGYLCQWDPNNQATHAYSLMRQYLGSGSPTVPGLFDRFQQHAGSSTLMFADVYDRTTAPRPSITELAAYIWDLQVRTPDTLQSTTGNKYKAQSPYPNVLPPYLEIRFKALSEAAARQLGGSSTAVSRTTWGNPSDALYQKIILPGTRQFSARIPLYSGNAAAVTPTPTP